MIQKATFIEGDLLEESRFAPYAEYVVFIIDNDYLIFEEEIIMDFDVEYYMDIFDITKTVE